jgi:hypothetical protein
VTDREMFGFGSNDARRERKRDECELQSMPDEWISSLNGVQSDMRHFHVVLSLGILPTLAGTRYKIRKG